ncbi:hypothetical protein MAR_004321, partial [Mya arenaria]
MCPVKNFKRYMSRLHPDLDDLWQRPRDSFNTTDDCWFCKSPLERNLLDIDNCSYVANHCIRATSISALDKAGFETRQIIRAIGHKLETSIKSYASRLTEGTKREMSDALSNAFLGAEQNAPMTSDIIPELSAHDLDQIFSAENDFSEVSRPIPTSEADMTTRGVLDQSFVTTNVSVDHSTNVAHIIPGSPQIINIPYMGGEQAYYNVTPQMSNCN